MTNKEYKHTFYYFKLPINNIKQIPAVTDLGYKVILNIKDYLGEYDFFLLKENRIIDLIDLMKMNNLPLNKAAPIIHPPVQNKFSPVIITEKEANPPHSNKESNDPPPSNKESNLSFPPSMIAGPKPRKLTPAEEH